MIAVGPGLTEDYLEKAEGLQYLPQRFHIVAETARAVLMDRDIVLRTIRDFDGEPGSESPF